MDRFREIAAMERRPAITGGKEPNPLWVTVGIIALVALMFGAAVGVMLL